MKKLLITLLAALATTTIQAKDVALLTDLDSWKMYTRPELFLTDIGGHSATFLDLGVGWMLNEKLSIGPAAALSLREIGDENGTISRFDLWYAGVRGDYTFGSSKLFHTSASLLFAGGSLKVDKGDSSGLMVIEPALNGAINIREDIELGLSFAYRFTDSIDADGFDEGDIRGVHFGLFARFTGF